MVAFHSTTQRLAVGTIEGPIGIYDMRTSARLEIFEGHTGSVKCLAFDTKGKNLVSYSASDLTLKLWKVGDNSFFS
jgi:WD repeat-containing protein 7